MLYYCSIIIAYKKPYEIIPNEDILNLPEMVEKINYPEFVLLI